MEFLSYLITGISLGSIYAIIALGYTMVYGIAKMLNFAHGDVIMVGAYVSFYVTMFAGSNLLGEDPSALTTGAVALVSVLLAMVVCTVLGVAIRAAGLPPPAPGRQPDRVDHRHRRQLLPAERSAAAVRRESQELHPRGQRPADAV